MEFIIAFEFMVRNLLSRIVPTNVSDKPFDGKHTDRAQRRHLAELYDTPKPKEILPPLSDEAKKKLLNAKLEQKRENEMWGWRMFLFDRWMAKPNSWQKPPADIVDGALTPEQESEFKAWRAEKKAERLAISLKELKRSGPGSGKKLTAYQRRRRMRRDFLKEEAKVAVKKNF